MSMLSDGTGSVGQMLGTISQTMMEQPLSLDQIYLWQNDATLPDSYGRYAESPNATSG